MSTRVFPYVFSGHAGLLYTQVIYSNPNTCMGTYNGKLNVGLEVLLTVLTPVNKYMMSYEYTHITTTSTI